MCNPLFGNRDITQKTRLKYRLNQEKNWVSVRRRNQCPLYIGVYYGKQETRVRKEDIEREFGELTEEVLELKQCGDVIIVMDANAKVGILGESVSRNGKYLLNMINEIPLENEHQLSKRIDRYDHNEDKWSIAGSLRFPRQAFSTGLETDSIISNFFVKMFSEVGILMSTSSSNMTHFGSV